MNLKLLQEQVKQVLKDNEQSRNNDDELVWEIWSKFYNVNEKYLYRKQYEAIPKASTIERCRRKIQNYLKLYPPTDWKVAEARGWMEEKWKEVLGYYTPDKNQLMFSDDNVFVKTNIIQT